MNADIEKYILDHISSEPRQLKELYRHTHLHHLYPRMCSGHYQGRILKMLTAMLAPQYVLELGTFTGYSALCLAEGIPPTGELHTIEIDDEMEDELRTEFDKSPYGSRIHLHIGDALDIVPVIDRVWDLVYIDANKRIYPEYYDLVLPRLRPGGFIIADNTLWDGKVVETSAPADPQTRGIMKFNDMIASDDRVESVILPLRDGLTIIRKR